MNSDINSAYQGLPPANSLQLQPLSTDSSRALHYGQPNSNQTQNLPPLQSSVYGHSTSGSQTPQSPATPNSAHHGNGIGPGQIQQQSLGLHGPHSHISPASIFPNPQSMMNNGGPSTTMNPNSASGPNGPRLPDLRPMPQGNGMASTPLPPFNTNISQLQHQASATDASDASPTHVVGSQGRRGILPTAPGRPAPVSGVASGPGRSQIERDAEGKFPCPCCNKTYLHQKHLKRHYLRHTGDRPYQCHLCLDTFSRSDILKRHFQKCSMRRGNPTGASHLANAHAHRRSQNAQAHRRSMSAVGEGARDALGISSMGPPPVTTQGNADLGLGSNNAATTVGGFYGNSMTSYSTPASRSNSIVGLSGLGQPYRHSVSGGSQVPSSRQSYDYSSDSQFAHLLSSATHSPSPSLSLGMTTRPMTTTSSQYDPTSASAGRPQPVKQEHGHVQHPNFNTNINNNYDWNNLFNATSPEGDLYSSTMDHKPHPESMQPSLQSPTDGSQDPLLNGMYGQVSDLTHDGFPSGFPVWSLDAIANDPLQSKADALLMSYFVDQSTQSYDDPPFGQPPVDEEMKQWLTVDNIRHCVERYTNFHGHWPFIHMPTFDLMQATDSLLLAIIAIGAVYSDQPQNRNIRRYMDPVKVAVRRHSHGWAVASGSLPTADSLQPSPSDIEDIQAFILLHVLFMWHGTQAQRQVARDEFTLIAGLASRFSLLQVIPPGHPGFSLLHHPGPLPSSAAASFDWNSWIEQEKRLRIVHFMFLVDSAQTLFFNVPPHFDPLTMRYQLPADDAAWEAATAAECSAALGLQSPGAQLANVTGSRRMKQPEVADALYGLIKSQHELPQRSSNTISKFILIHALLSLIWTNQKQLNLGINFPGYNAMTATGTATPNSFQGWPGADSSGTNSGALSAANSGPVTPTDTIFGGATPQQRLRMIWDALDRWKRAWDIDIAIQYPPNSTVYRRFGFSRDAIHFYYLGKHLIQHPQPSDTSLPADVRMRLIMRVLRNIRNQMLHQTGARAQDLGSVGDIDDRYGVEDLTLDMKLLFKPLNEQIDSPIRGVQTNLPTHIM